MKEVKIVEVLVFRTWNGTDRMEYLGLQTTRLYENEFSLVYSHSYWDGPGPNPFVMPRPFFQPNPY